MATESTNGGNGAASGNGNGGGSAETPQPKLQIVTQYIRDLSFENIAVQKGANAEAKPDVRVQVNLDAQKRGDNRYEVALKLNVDSKAGDVQLFLLELDYGGLFVVENVPDDQLHPLLMIECPRLIFPFVRRIVGDVTRDGGYPPLNLDLIDFMRLYRTELARRQATQQEGGEAPKADA